MSQTQQVTIVNTDVIPEPSSFICSDSRYSELYFNGSAYSTIGVPLGDANSGALIGSVVQAFTDGQGNVKCEVNIGVQPIPVEPGQSFIPPGTRAYINANGKVTPVSEGALYVIRINVYDYNGDAVTDVNQFLTLEEAEDQGVLPNVQGQLSAKRR